MSSALVCRADRHLLIKAGLFVCLGILVLSGCSREAAPVQQRVGSAQRTAPGEVSVATAMGQSVAAYPDRLRSASSPLTAQTDERNQTNALVLFTSMRKARVLHGLR